MKRKITIEYNGQSIDLWLTLDKYQNGGTACMLFTMEQEPFAVLSVWTNDSPKLPEGVFFLKTWSENEPVVKALYEQGVIEIAQDNPPSRTAPGGFTVYAFRLGDPKRILSLAV